MDISDILANLDRIIAIVGVLVGLGGTVAAYIAKLKIKEVLNGAKEILDAVDYFQKADADHVWTETEDKLFGMKTRIAIKRVEPVIRKLLKK